MKNRIVILGDSLSMPRPDETINFEDTYQYHLIKKGHEVISRSKRANDTQIQINEQNILDDVIFLKPDIVIIHLGIVDCAPRLFTKIEQKILLRVPSYLQKKIINFFSERRFFFTKLRNISYVTEVKFISNLNYLLNRINSITSNIILIKIKNTSDNNEKKSFSFQNKIDTYNDILQDLANEKKLIIIDPNDFKDGLLEDGIHINCDMHKYLSDELINVVNKI